MFNKLRNTILDVNAADASVKVNKTGAGIASGIAAVAASTSMAFANSISKDLFEPIKNFAKDIYTGIDNVLIYIALTVVAIAFLIRMISNNPKTIDNATAWIKRVAFTYIAWRIIGTVVTAIDNSTEGRQFNWQ